MADKKQPLQPIKYVDGSAQFHPNAIVRFLLDAGPFDMNTISCLPGVSNQDRAQFAALIGYPVSGWGELSYVHEGCPEELAEAERIAAEAKGES